MKKLTQKAVVTVSLLALIVVPGAAFAAQDDDTVINIGYDEDSQFFMWNVTSLDYEPWIEAAEADDELSADDIDALVEACGLDLTGEGTDLEYTADLNDDGEFEITLSDDGGEIDTVVCSDFAGAFVTGPNGQVNHGMFLKTFNQIYDGPNRGCVVRHIAQSDLGKGDQQVTANPDADDDDTGEPIESVEGTATFSTAVEACLRAKPDKSEAESDEESEKGPPQHVRDKFGGDHPRDAKGNKPDKPAKARP